MQKCVAPVTFPDIFSFVSFFLLPVSGYEGAELNMDFFWILLLCCVCSLSRGQGVYGENLSLTHRVLLCWIRACSINPERVSSVATTLIGEIISP